MAKRSIAAILILAALLLVPSCDAEAFLRGFGTNVLGGLDSEKTVNEINEIFSRIRFFFMMRPFAKQSQLAAPVTEMEIEPLLFQMSRTLEQARAAIENALELPDPLPVHLSIPDMSQFIIEYFGVEQEKSRRIADELADALCFEFKNGIYKLSVN